jgi:hypothetical protein
MADEVTDAPDLTDPTAVPEVLWAQIHTVRDKILGLAKGDPSLAKAPTWLIVTALMAASIRIAYRAGVNAGVMKGMFSYFWGEEREAKGKAQEKRGGGSDTPPGPKVWKKTADTDLAKNLEKMLERPDGPTERPS